jgi:hypothetical protein
MMRQSDARHWLYRLVAMMIVYVLFGQDANSFFDFVLDRRACVRVRACVRACVRGWGVGGGGWDPCDCAIGQRVPEGSPVRQSNFFGESEKFSPLSSNLVPQIQPKLGYSEEMLFSMPGIRQ